MKIRQLSIFEFDKFALSHPLSSYYQTSNYALFQSEQGNDYDLIGLVNEKNEESYNGELVDFQIDKDAQNIFEAA